MSRLHLVPILALIMWVIFLASAYLPPDLQREFYTSFALRLFLPVDNAFLWLLSWSVALFLHGSLAHIFFNSFGLVTLGSFVYPRLGGWRFLAFFFLAGWMGALAHALLNWGEPAILLGASATVFALLAALPYLQKDFATLSWRAKSLLLARHTLFIMLLNLGFAYVAAGTPEFGGARISWEAHAGGYLAGMLLFPWLQRPRPPEEEKEEEEEERGGEEET